MKFKSILLTSLLTSCSIAFAHEPLLLEDFSGHMSLHKTNTNNGKVEINNEELNISVATSSFTTEHVRNQFRMIDATINNISVDITVNDYEIDTDSATQSQAILARIFGRFYNTESANPTDGNGNVWATVGLIDSGNGLEAYYAVGHYINDEDIYLAREVIKTGLSTGTPYSTSIDFDESNSTFTFTVDGTIATFTGPTRLGEARSGFKRLDAGITFGWDIANIAANKKFSELEISDSGIPASVNASFDNATITDESSTVFNDAFTSNNFNDDIWQGYHQSGITHSLRDHSIDETSAKMNLTAFSLSDVDGNNNTIQSRTRINLNPEIQSQSLAAKLSLQDTSDLTSNGDGKRARVRLRAHFFNDTYAPEDTANGYEGNIWATFGLQHRNGSLGTTAYATRIDDADWTTDTPFTITPVNSFTPQFNTEYQFEIRAIESTSPPKIEFYIDDLLIGEASLASGKTYYPHNVSHTAHKRIEARQDAIGGQLYATVDDIEITPPIVETLSDFAGIYLDTFDDADESSIEPDWVQSLVYIDSNGNGKAYSQSIENNAVCYIDDNDTFTLTLDPSLNGVFIADENEGEPTEKLSMSKLENAIIIFFRDTEDRGSVVLGRSSMQSASDIPLCSNQSSGNEPTYVTSFNVLVGIWSDSYEEEGQTINELIDIQANGNVQIYTESTDSTGICYEEDDTVTLDTTPSGYLFDGTESDGSTFSVQFTQASDGFDGYDVTADESFKLTTTNIQSSSEIRMCSTSNSMGGNGTNGTNSGSNGGSTDENDDDGGSGAYPLTLLLTILSLVWLRRRTI